MRTNRIAPSATELAWAAGLFEGEGCLSSSPRGKRRNGVQLRLGSTDLDVVQRFAEVVACGTIQPPRKWSGEHRKHWKPLHDWCLYDAASVAYVIEMLLPWFGERRRAKALEVLAIAREIGLRKGKRTHCPQGHPYEGANLIREPIMRAGKSYVARRCRTCRRAKALGYHRHRKARESAVIDG
jgi:hypothetical protein